MPSGPKLFSPDHPDTSIQEFNEWQASRLRLQQGRSIDESDGTARNKYNTGVQGTIGTPVNDLFEALTKLEELAGPVDFQNVKNNVKIGLTHFEVPPQNIQISTRSESLEIPSLRSTTNTLVKTGHSSIMIVLELLFSDVEAMNRELRMLVSQFRLSPILPLKSRYIANAINPPELSEKKSEKSDKDEAPERDYNRKREELANAIQKDLDQLSKNVTLLIDIVGPPESDRDDDGESDSDEVFRKLLTNMRELTEKGFSETHLEKITQEINDLRGIVGSTNSVIKNQSSNAYFLTTLKRILDLYIKIQDKARRLRTLRAEVQGLVNGMPEVKSDVIPVILREIRVNTTESDSEAVSATLALNFFNHKPYSQFFEFRDHLGMPTELIDNCPWYHKYISSALENPDDPTSIVTAHRRGRRYMRRIERTRRGHFGIRYPTTKLVREEAAASVGYRSAQRKSSVQVRMNDGSNRFLNSFDTPLILDGTVGYVNEYRDFFIEKTDPNIILNKVSVNLVNRVAQHRILSSIYPTAQYVGGLNARIAIDLCVTGSTAEEHDKALGALVAIKREAERVSVMYGPRARRDSKLIISNDIMNLMGIHAVQLEDMNIQTDGPNKSYVRLSMIEYTSSPTENEGLKSNLGSLTDRIKRLIEWGAPKAKKARDTQLRALQNLPTISDISGKPIEINRDGLPVETLLPDRDNSLNGIFYRDALAGIEHTKYRSLRTDQELVSDPIFRQEANRIRRILLAQHRSYGDRLEELKNLIRTYEAIAKAQGETLVDNPDADTPREQYGRFKYERLKRKRMFIRLADYLKKFRILFEHGKESGALTRPALQEAQRRQEDILGATSDVQQALDSLEELIQGTGNAQSDGINFLQPGVRSQVNVAYPTLIPLQILIYAILKNGRLVLALKAVSASKENFRILVEEYASLLLMYWSGLITLEHERIQVYRRYTSVPFPDTVNDGEFKDAILEVFRQLEAEDTVTVHDNVDTVLPPRPTVRDLQMAFEAVSWVSGHYPEFAVQQRTIADRLVTDSAHPDLFLPSYGDVFSEVFRVLGIDPAGEINLNKQPAWKRALLKRFMPTYRDLGIKPPVDGSPNDIARVGSDEVEPAFFWYHTRTTDDPDFQLFVDAAKQVQNTVKRNRIETGRSGLPIIDASGSTKDVTNPSVETNDYAPAVRQSLKNIGLFNIESAEHASQILDEALRNIKDDVYSMRRAYPGFKLYFVEPNNQGIGILDDLYGYNSVSSIKVHRHKFYPDTLELELINVTGNLDQNETALESKIEGDLHRLSTEHDVPGLRNQGTVPDTIKQLQSEVQELVSPKLKDPVTGKKAGLNDIFLREGTMLVLKMGYTNKPSEMETVFTGQIAEIMRGDILRMVAQSYGSELTVPVNKKDAKSPLEAIASVMEDEAPVHFGTIKAQLPEFQAEQDARRAIYSGIDRDNIVLRTRRLDNVFLPGEGHNYKWHIPNKIGLEVVNEITRHFPGLISGVRPYDHNATLFMGYPSKPYRYTDDGLFEQLRQTSKVTNGAGRFPAGFYTYSDRRNQDAIAFAIELMLAFSGRAQRTSSSDRTYASQHFIDWVAGQGAGGIKDVTFTYPEEPLELTVARLRYYTDSFFERGITIDDPTDRTDLLDNLERKIGRDTVEEVVRLFFNDIHWLTTNDFLHYRPVMLAKQDGATAWTGLGNAFREFGRFGQTVEEGVVQGARVVESLLDSSAASRTNTALDGNKLVAIPDFMQRLRRLLKPINELSNEDISRDILEKNGAFRSADNINIPNWSNSADRIAAATGAFRGFLIAFNRWVESFDPDDEVFNSYKENVTKNSMLKNEKLEEGFRLFRRYHWVDSERHIMDNRIRVTKDEMANIVQVKHPDSHDVVNGDDNGLVMIKSDVTWKNQELAYHKNLRPQDKKQQIFTEINADDEARAKRCAISNLRQSLSKMYRGELVIEGDARIEPHDVLYVFDWYNLMFGPVEVEGITHVFTPETGFASIVNPECLVINGHESDLKQAVAETTIINRYVGKINVREADNIVRGSGNNDEDTLKYKSHVDVLPLTYNGRPWIAGIRGPDDEWFTLKLDGRWDLWREGAAQIVRGRIYNSRGDR